MVLLCYQETIDDLQFFRVALTFKCLLDVALFDSSTAKIGHHNFVLLIPNGVNRLVLVYELSQVPFESSVVCQTMTCDTLQKYSCGMSLFLFRFLLQGILDGYGCVSGDHDNLQSFCKSRRGEEQI